MKHKSELEKQLDLSIARVHKEGSAHIRKMCKSFRLYSNETGMYLRDVRLRKQVYPPYVGAIKGGRMIAFDFVSVDGQAARASKLSVEQVVALEEYKSMGAQACIFISFGNGRKFYRIPVGLWANMKEQFDRNFITAKDISEFEIKFRNGIYDLFDGLLEG